MTRFRTTLTAATVLAALALTSTADARASARIRGQNGGAAVVAGQKGVAGRAGGTVRSEDGTVTHASGGGFAGANGTRGARASTTSVSPDGTVNRQSGASTSGAAGNASSQGAFTRDASGNISGTRSTNATSNATGNSYSGATSVNNGEVTHTGACTNSAGEAIPCR